MTVSSDLHSELGRYRLRMGVPAAIAAVTDADGVRAIEVVGARSRAQPQSVATIDDQWHIGSCGKSITALLYACLVEAGLAAWHTPVCDLFPDVGPIDAGWAGPTVDDLLRCRAGVAPNPSISEMRRLFNRADPIVDQRSEAAATVLRTAPKNPGRFRYSNLGYVIVGAAIDRLTGMAYEEAMQHWVWGPLGVTSAGLGPPPHVIGHRPRVQLGPLTAGRGRPAPVSEPADNPLLFNPAGRWHLTVSDWARVQRVFLQHVSPLLSRESIDHLLADPHSGRGRSMSMGWTSGKDLGATHAMQGSNTWWAATATMDREAQLTALLVINDGRTRVLTTSAKLAGRLLQTFR
ncbi:MAG: serine hydrolase [bacterium]|nr:serine hydrolase [bacterium]